jgi:RHS repeat-associated protein
MTTYSYDRENRLISQNVDGNVTSFAYDGFGRKRRESRGVNPDVILNWDGDQMIVESSDLDPEAPSKAYYVADGVIYAENANLGSRKSRRDYAVDFLGSVTGLTDSDSGISSVRRWSAYGKLLSGSSEPIGYFWTGNTGSRVYQSLGLNDNRARHYGRNIKQWITRDPLWPSELPYTYVGGNPVTWIDPSGEGSVPPGNSKPLCPPPPRPSSKIECGKSMIQKWNAYIYALCNCNRQSSLDKLMCEVIGREYFIKCKGGKPSNQPFQPPSNGQGIIAPRPRPKPQCGPGLAPIEIKHPYDDLRYGCWDAVRKNEEGTISSPITNPRAEVARLYMECLRCCARRNEPDCESPCYAYKLLWLQIWGNEFHDK